MTMISVPDMMCSNCVRRITDALTKAGLKFSVSLENKRVELDGDTAAVRTALSEISDLGFSPEVQA
jgi:copper chaperone